MCLDNGGHASSNLNEKEWERKMQPDVWKHAQIRLKSDNTKCLTVKAKELVLDECVGHAVAGGGGGHRPATQQFTYKFYSFSDGWHSLPFGEILSEHPGDTDEAAVSLDMGPCSSDSPDFPCPVILGRSEIEAHKRWILDDTYTAVRQGRDGQITTILGWTPDLDDEWWKPHKKEALCMQPKNDYFGSQIVAGKCKKHNSKQQWEIVGEKVRKAEQ